MRKKLKWENKPFEIPKNIMDEWKKIGEKGEKLEKKWKENLNKKNPKIKSELENIYINSNLDDLEKLISKEKSKFLNQNQILQLDNALLKQSKVLPVYCRK